MKIYFKHDFKIKIIKAGRERANYLPILKYVIFKSLKVKVFIYLKNQKTFTTQSAFI